MRTLLLLRHAKSSWAHDGLEDHERPLNPRGMRDAPEVGAYLTQHDLRPDLVICSDAVRTRATLTLLLSKLAGEPPKVVIEPRLYHADPTAILEIIKHLPADARRCLLVGHNPGVHALALHILSTGDKGDVTALAMKFPTAGLAVFDLDGGSWKSVGARSGRLRAFVTPRRLHGPDRPPV